MTTTKKVNVEDTLEDLKHLYDCWIRFRKYFLKAFSNDAIGREEEQKFLEIKSHIAKYHRVLSEEVDENLYFAGDKIIELLRKCISVSHLRSLPLVDKNLYYKTWHYIFIYLGRTVGAYQFFREGFVPTKRLSKKESGMTISKVKAMAGSQGEGKGKKGSKAMGIVAGIIVVIIIAVAVMVISQR